MNQQLIDDLIADLEHDLEVTTERLRLARELRASFEPEAQVEVEVSPEVEVAPERPAKKAAAKPTRRSKQVTYPDCGEVKGSAAGLAQHRKHKHPGSAAKPIEPLRSVPADPQVKGKVLRCSCDAELPNFKALAAHTHDEHQGRAPTSVERTPVAPRAAA